MKISTIILCALVLIGCAYTVTYTNRAPSEIIVQSEPPSESKKTHKIEISGHDSEPKGGAGMSRPMPAPIILPNKQDIEKRSRSTEIIEPSIIEKTETVSQKLFKASLAFAMLEKANVNEDIKAQLLIDPNKEVNNLTSQLTVKGTATAKEIKVSKIVKATLVAPDFNITKITEEEQILSDTEPTEWLWTLSPKSAGNHEVNLSVTAIIKIDGRESKYHLKTFDKTIVVEITKAQVLTIWLNENWKWIISTLIIPLIVFMFKEKFKTLISRLID